MSKIHSELSSKLKTVSHFIGKAKFVLHPYGGMYLEDKAMLFISDTHFGKVTHFRKSGIAVPMEAIQENWKRLDSMISHFKCKQVIFLGDLFHSEVNVEWDHFASLLNVYSDIDFCLVRGNHDILDAYRYADAGIEVVEHLVVDDIHFSHHPEEVEGKYNIHGHIHPGVLMRGKGMGSRKLRCFYFGKNVAIMPAFGSFTGSMRVEVKKGDAVFVLVEDQVISV